VIAGEVGFKPPEDADRYRHLVLKLIAVAAFFIGRNNSYKYNLNKI
jgi:hypothetical protein